MNIATLSPEFSDDDDADLVWNSSAGNVSPAVAAVQPEEVSGTLSKWTNYIHGWQDR